MKREGKKGNIIKEEISVITCANSSDGDAGCLIPFVATARVSEATWEVMFTSRSPLGAEQKHAHTIIMQDIRPSRGRGEGAKQVHAVTVRTPECGKVGLDRSRSADETRGLQKEEQKE